MKEETPITVEERAIQYLNQIGLESSHCFIQSYLQSYFNDDDKSYYEVFELMAGFAREHAQAKVLEALEREVPIAHDKGFDKEYVGMHLNGDEFPKGTEYYETEVKPKYE